MLQVVLHEALTWTTAHTALLLRHRVCLLNKSVKALYMTDEVLVSDKVLLESVFSGFYLEIKASSRKKCFVRAYDERYLYDTSKPFAINPGRPKTHTTFTPKHSRPKSLAFIQHHDTLNPSSSVPHGNLKTVDPDSLTPQNSCQGLSPNLVSTLPN